MTDPAASDPLASVGTAGGFYPIFRYRILFTSVAKNACTSLKWLLAELAGEDLAKFAPRSGFQPNRAAGIHRRKAWDVPRLSDLDPAARAEIHPDNGWFVFGVTRDPRTRFFSAWQSKYLLRNPITLREPDRRPLTPRLPRTAEEVIEDFAGFTELFAADPQQPAFKGDPHFRSQVSLLRPAVVPYSRIYDVSELATLLADLEAHVVAQGHPGGLRLNGFNDTPLSANRRVFGNGVREQIEKVFADDFARFGNRWDFTRVEARDLTWGDAAFAHVRAVAEANERITDLVLLARDLERKQRRLRRKVRALRTGRDTRPLAARLRRLLGS